jgi:hypothetical protein
MQHITVEMAKECATLMTSDDISLEAKSSQPNVPAYFQPLSLPPASPNWTWRDNATVTEVARACLAAAPVHQVVTPPFASRPPPHSRNQGPGLPSSPMLPSFAETFGDLPLLGHATQALHSQVQQWRTSDPALYRIRGNNNHPPESGHEHALGQGPRIGRRAALQYRIDANRWQAQAMRRWGAQHQSSGTE